MSLTGTTAAAFYHFLKDKFGEEKLSDEAVLDVLKACDVAPGEIYLPSQTSFKADSVYSEDIYLKVVHVLLHKFGDGLTADQCLFEFGQYFLMWLSERTGYGKSLDRVAETLVDFTRSLNRFLDQMFNLLGNTRSSIPQIHVTNVTLNTFDIFIRRDAGSSTSRTPFIQGMLDKIASFVFEIEIEFELLEDHGSLECDVLMRVSSQSTLSLGTTEPEFLPHAGRSLMGIDPESFYKLFPFHLVLDMEMKVLQAGSILQKIIPQLRVPSVKITEVLTIQSPRIPWELDSINLVLLNERQRLILNSQNGVSLQGGIYKLPRMQREGEQLVQGEPCFVLLLSPYMHHFEDMTEHDLYLSDFPCHDTTPDLLLLSDDRFFMKLDLAEERQHNFALKETLVETLAAQASGAGRTSFHADSAADVTISLLDMLILGEEVDMHQVLEVRDALLKAGTNLWKPLDLNAQAMDKDEEVSQSLGELLGASSGTRNPLERGRRGIFEAQQSMRMDTGHSLRVRHNSDDKEPLPPKRSSFLTLESMPSMVRHKTNFPDLPMVSDQRNRLPHLSLHKGEQELDDEHAAGRHAAGAPTTANLRRMVSIGPHRSEHRAEKPDCTPSRRRVSVVINDAVYVTNRRSGDRGGEPAEPRREPGLQLRPSRSHDNLFGGLPSGSIASMMTAVGAASVGASPATSPAAAGSGPASSSSSSGGGSADHLRKLSAGDRKLSCGDATAHVSAFGQPPRSCDPPHTSAPDLPTKLLLPKEGLNGHPSLATMVSPYLVTANRPRPFRLKSLLMPSLMPKKNGLPCSHSCPEDGHHDGSSCEHHLSCNGLPSPRPPPLSNQKENELEADAAHKMLSQVSDPLNRVLAAVEDWQLDLFEVDRVSNGRPLSFLAFHLFKRMDLTKNLKLNERKLSRFLMRIEDGYADNPYHSRVHAADVLRSFHVILTKGGVLQALMPRSTSLSQLAGAASSTEECDPFCRRLLACYLAAITHDFEHKGVTNDFLIRCSDPLALLYNDISPQENHHVSASFMLMKHPQYAFFPPASKQMQDSIRKEVIDMVLATDMKQHFALLGIFNSKVVSSWEHVGTQQRQPTASGSAPELLSVPSDGSEMLRLASIRIAQDTNGDVMTRAASIRAIQCEGGLTKPPSMVHRATSGSRRISMIADHNNSRRLQTISVPGIAVGGSRRIEAVPALGSPNWDQETQMLILKIALKCSDLGHLASSRDVHMQWVSRLEQEMFGQGDQEKSLGEFVSPLMDRTKAGVTKSQCGFFNVVALPMFKSLAHVFSACDDLHSNVVANNMFWKEAETKQGAGKDAGH